MRRRRCNTCQGRHHGEVASTGKAPGCNPAACNSIGCSNQPFSTNFMNHAEAYILLKENGFHYVRDARHGEIWSNEATTIMLAHGNSDQHRQKKFICDIKRAVRIKTQKKQPVVQQPKINVQVPEAYNQAKAGLPATTPTNPGPVQLPDIIIAILVDGSLSDTQKIKMIFAYMEL